MFDIPDIINGAFEMFCALFICLSILKLHRDKKVRGISYAHMTFCTFWGFWNLYYYPHLRQYASFVGGVIIVIVNFTWLMQMIYYRKERNNEKGI